MKPIYTLLLCIFSFSVFGQALDSLYAISFKTVQNPTTLQNTNGIVRVAKFHPSVGFLNNIGLGTNTVGGNFSIDGGSINQINNTYNLIGSNSFMTFELNTGNFIQQTPIVSFSPEGTTHFGMVRFNNSNASLYGLARVSVAGSPQSIYLAKLNTLTGNLTQLSQNPIPFQSIIAGTVIDPDQMIYYFSSPNKFIGLDLYNGNVYSSADYVFSNPQHFGFANFAFDCSSSQIYGLIRGRFLSPNATVPNGYEYYLRLGKINPETGVVTEISTVNLPATAYSVGASATLDELNQIYYFVGNGLMIYGVSLHTGAVVSSVQATFNDANNLFFINNYNNCINRTALREDPAVLNTNDLKQDNITIYPNPTSKILYIDAPYLIDKVEVYDANGRMVRQLLGQNKLYVEDLQSGVYFLRIFDQGTVRNLKFVKSSN